MNWKWLNKTLFISILFFCFSFKQKEAFVLYKPCSFQVKLPKSFSLKPMEEESSPDYCDLSAKNKNGKTLIEFHSLIKGRFMKEKVDELYEEAIAQNQMNITYKVKKENWFVISGTDKLTGKIIYWKRSVGEHFISDMNVVYDKADAKLIEPYLGKISNSFSSF